MEGGGLGINRVWLNDSRWRRPTNAGTLPVPATRPVERFEKPLRGPHVPRIGSMGSGHDPMTKDLRHYFLSFSSSLRQAGVRDPPLSECSTKNLCKSHAISRAAQNIPCHCLQIFMLAPPQTSQPRNTPGPPDFAILLPTLYTSKHASPVRCYHPGCKRKKKDKQRGLTLRPSKGKDSKGSNESSANTGEYASAVSRGVQRRTGAVGTECDPVGFLSVSFFRLARKLGDRDTLSRVLRRDAIKTWESSMEGWPGTQHEITR